MRSLSLRVSALAGATLLLLPACGGPDDESPSEPNSPTSLPNAASTVATTEPSPTPTPPTQFSAFDIVGEFPGAVREVRGERVLVAGQGDENLGDTLRGLSLFTASGTLLGAMVPEITPCAATLAGENGDLIVTNEVAFLDPEGTLKGGTVNTLRIYDDQFSELQRIELPEYRGDARELWKEPTVNDGCTAVTTGDGKYVVTYDATGWYAVDLATMAAELVLPHYEDGREDDLPSRVFPLGEDIVMVPSREMLAPVAVSVVDPSTSNAIKTYPLYDNSAEDTTPEGSREAQLAAGAADAEWLIDPSEPAVMYTYAGGFDGDFSPVKFDLASGEVTRIGPAGLAGVPELDFTGEVFYFIDDEGDDPVLRAYSASKNTELWNAENVTDVCSSSEDQVAVAANDQLVVLSKTDGTQVSFNGEVATTGIFGGSACAPVNVAGFGWGIDDNAMQGAGGSIVSYFDQVSVD